MLTAFSGVRVLFLVLDPHHRDLREALFKTRRAQFSGHPSHHVFRHHPRPLAVPFQADLHRHIEKYRLHLVTEVFRQLDPAMAIMRRQVRCIHVVHRTPCNESRFQHRAQIGKNKVLEALLGCVVKEKFPQQVARQRSDVVPLEPRTLSRSRQADRQHNHSFRSTWCRWTRGRGRRRDLRNRFRFHTGRCFHCRWCRFYSRRRLCGLSFRRGGRLAASPTSTSSPAAPSFRFLRSSCAFGCLWFLSFARLWFLDLHLGHPLHLLGLRLLLLKIGRLQWRCRCLCRRFRGFWSPLRAIAHPFPHVRLLTHRRTRRQSEEPRAIVEPPPLRAHPIRLWRFQTKFVARATSVSRHSGRMVSAFPPPFGSVKRTERCM